MRCCCCCYYYYYYYYSGQKWTRDDGEYKPHQGRHTPGFFEPAILTKGGSLRQDTSVWKRFRKHPALGVSVSRHPDCEYDGHYCLAVNRDIRSMT